MLSNQPLVFDNGSSIIKAGVAGEETPRAVVPAVLGRPKHPRAMVTGLDKDLLIGETALAHRGLCRLVRPTESAVVSDWDNLERLWHHVYASCLEVPSENHPVLLTEAPLNPRKNRETAAQVLFESLNVPAAYFALPAVLSLYAAGKTTGIVLDVGDGQTSAVPVYQGFAVTSAVGRTDIGGNLVTLELQALLRRQGVSLVTSAEHELAREIKEQQCYLASDVVKERKQHALAPKQKYTLPDGVVIELGLERFLAPEVLFDPLAIGREEPGCGKLLLNSVSRSDLDLRASLYSTVLVSGGASLTKGFGERLLGELRTSAPTGTKLKIYAPADRKYSAWMGGSILAGLSTFTSMWVSAKDYNENPDVVHSRGAF